MEWLASSDPSTPFSFNPADEGDVTPDQNGGLIYSGSLQGDMWQMSWTTRARNTSGTAYLDTVVSVINTSDDIQAFSLDTSMSLTDPLTNPGEVDLAGSLALTNIGFEANAVATDVSGQSLVEVGLNGTPEGSLFDGPYLLQANGPFASAIDSATSSIPTLGLLNEMSILTTFQLSPGDLLNITVVMDVSDIPAPGVLSLLALTGLASTRSRRRRSTSWRAGR
tara:strand:+ start:2643 stop:3311 length:669 start_codon:yes stop_codon:yes gene_type:complete